MYYRPVKTKKILLKREWLGHPKGKKVSIPVGLADNLISRRSAIEVKGEEVIKKVIDVALVGEGVIAEAIVPRSSRRRRT